MAYVWISSCTELNRDSLVNFSGEQLAKTPILSFRDAMFFPAPASICQRLTDAAIGFAGRPVSVGGRKPAPLDT
jgi:hypothetical protein